MRSFAQKDRNPKAVNRNARGGRDDDTGRPVPLPATTRTRTKTPPTPRTNPKIPLREAGQAPAGLDRSLPSRAR